MSIDEKTKDEKVIVVRAGNKLKFEETIQKLYKVAKKETKFKGDFENVEETKAYFSKYEIGPAFENNRIIGMQLKYIIGAQVQPEKKSRAGSGCGPGKDYSF